MDKSEGQNPCIFADISFFFFFLCQRFGLCRLPLVFCNMCMAIVILTDQSLSLLTSVQTICVVPSQRVCPVRTFLQYSIGSALLDVVVTSVDSTRYSVSCFLEVVAPFLEFLSTVNREKCVI